MFIWSLRYWYAVLSTLLSLGLFALLEFGGSSRLATIAVIVYIVLIGAVYYNVYAKTKYRLTVGSTLLTVVLGSIGLFLLIELVLFRQLFALFLSVCIGAIFYIPQRFGAQLAHEYKPWRRMFVSIVTLGVCSSITTLYGFDMFFQFPMIGWYALFGTMISSFMAYAIFRLYYPRHSRRMLIWTLVLALISFQLFLTIAYLPFGYLWLGLVYMWVWYTAVTLIRFHVSPKGVIWSKQRYFLTGTFITFLLLLVLAQWV